MFRLPEFTDSLKEWLTNGKGLVVAACVNEALSPDITAVNAFLYQYGLQYTGPGWAGNTELTPQLDALSKAHFGKRSLKLYINSSWSM